MKVKTGKIPSPKKVCIYGPEGIGKSTFASQFPSPIFIDTEGSTKELDVHRFDRSLEFHVIQYDIEELFKEKHNYKTLVIDTVDWLETYIESDVCKKANKQNIEDFGYGRGYTYLKEKFQNFLYELTELQQHRGMHILFVAHSEIVKFEQPESAGSYDRYQLKCSKKITPLIKEWVDLLLFVNYKTFVVDSEGKKRAVGGRERILYTQHSPSWDAKNRHNLKDEIPFAYDSIKFIIDNSPEPVPAPASTPPATQAEKPPIADIKVPALDNKDKSQDPPLDRESQIQLINERLSADNISEDRFIRFLFNKSLIPTEMSINELPSELLDKLQKSENWNYIKEKLATKGPVNNAK